VNYSNAKQPPETLAFASRKTHDIAIPVFGHKN
jgi:hypothetical protein